MRGSHPNISMATSCPGGLLSAAHGWPWLPLAERPGPFLVVQSSPLMPASLLQKGPQPLRRWKSPPRKTTRDAPSREQFFEGASTGATSAGAWGVNEGSRVLKARGPSFFCRIWDGACVAFVANRPLTINYLFNERVRISRKTLRTLHLSLTP